MGRRKGRRWLNVLFFVPKKTTKHLKINMTTLKRILLAEDNRKDVELTLAALAEHRLANAVTVARDGAEALDYLRRRGKFAGHKEGLPVVVLLDLKMPKVDGLGGVAANEV